MKKSYYSSSVSHYSSSNPLSSKHQTSASYHFQDSFFQILCRLHSPSTHKFYLQVIFKPHTIPHHSFHLDIGLKYTENQWNLSHYHNEMSDDIIQSYRSMILQKCLEFISPFLSSYWKSLIPTLNKILSSSFKLSKSKRISNTNKKIKY